MDLQKRTWAEIDLSAIEHNYRTIRRTLPEGCKFLGVVKADAYGHGAVQVSRTLERAGADYLAVSCLDEALELREAGIAMPILILGHTPPEYTGLLIRNRLTQTVSCEAKARAYDREAAGYGEKLRIHIKVDTGMSRLGFLCADGYFEQGVQNIAAACSLPRLAPEGIYTHFAVSDEPGEDARAYTEGQLTLFLRVLEALRERHDLTFALRHAANSGAVLHYPEASLDMVRPGLLLYGCGDGGALGLRPAMRLLTRVSTIKFYPPGTLVSYGGIYKTEKTTRMGVLPIGYADGLMRSLSNRCSFYAGDGLAPQRGRICMDMCMADLSDRPEAGVDTPVEIFGPHVPVEVQAEIAGTIPYELLCAVSKRVPRVYAG